MKLNNKQYITKQGIVKKNPVKKKNNIDKQILSYDVDQIDYALQELGFPTDYTYFVGELKTYSLDDKKELLAELRNNEE
ncbi:MAG: hypothetical protein ACOCP8_09100 [archaeon]